MNICAVMVTEDRAPIAPVAFASFVEQWYEAKKKHLHVSLPLSDLDAYRRAAFGVGLEHVTWNAHVGHDTVPQRLTRTIDQVFLDGTAEVITLWNDDDYSPPDRLVRLRSAVELWHPEPVVVSYNSGFFVNARTLCGSRVDVPHLWGGCLTFNRAAYERAEGFCTPDFPGEDRAFVGRAERGGAKVVTIAAPTASLPVAFIHGKNVATFPRGEMVPLDDRLRATMPYRVWRTVQDFQSFCIAHRIFPAGSQ